MEETGRGDTYCMPLHVVQTKVPKVTQAYCGARLPVPSHVMHRLFPSSLRSPRRIFSCFALTAAELDIVA